MKKIIEIDGNKLIVVHTFHMGNLKDADVYDMGDGVHITYNEFNNVTRFPNGKWEMSGDSITMTVFKKDTVGVYLHACEDTPLRGVDSHKDLQILIPYSDLDITLSEDD